MSLKPELVCKIKIKDLDTGSQLPPITLYRKEIPEDYFLSDQECICDAIGSMMLAIGQERLSYDNRAYNTLSGSDLLCEIAFCRDHLVMTRTATFVVSAQSLQNGKLIAECLEPLSDFFEQFSADGPSMSDEDMETQTVIGFT